MLLTVSVGASELTIMPTLESTFYKFKIKSLNETLARDEFVLANDLLVRSNYTNRYLESNLEANLNSIRYSESKVANVSTLDFKWHNVAKFRDDNLLFKGGIVNKKQTFDTIRGGFSDDFFNDDTSATLIIDTLGMTYRIPASNYLDGKFDHLYDSRRVKYVVDKNTSAFTTNESSLRIGHYEDPNGLYISIEGKINRQDRQIADDFSNSETSGTIRLPLFNTYYFVINGFNGEYKNDSAADGFNFSNDEIGTEKTIFGSGFAWVRSHSGKYIQITREYDVEKDKYYIGGNAQWTLGGRLVLNGTLTRRFYGEKKGYSLSYIGKKNSFSFRYSEDVRLSYLLLATNVVEGVYICSPVDNDFSEFDPNICRLPDTLNTELQQGELLVTNINTEFPLVDRLLFEGKFNVDWQYQGVKWSHKLSLVDLGIQDLEFANNQDHFEGFFDSSYELTNTSSIEVEWRFRTTEVYKERGDPSKGSIDRLYGLSYHKNLNTVASWAVGIKHINHQDSTGEYNFVDNRVYLSYKYHFGKQNDYRRDFFPMTVK